MSKQGSIRYGLSKWGAATSLLDGLMATPPLIIPSLALIRTLLAFVIAGMATLASAQERRAAHRSSRANNTRASRGKRNKRERACCGYCRQTP